MTEAQAAAGAVRAGVWHYPPDTVLTLQAVAEILGVTVRTLYRRGIRTCGRGRTLWRYVIEMLEKEASR